MLAFRMYAKIVTLLWMLVSSAAFSMLSRPSLLRRASALTSLSMADSSMSCVDINVNSLSKSLDFYSKCIGMTIDAQDTASASLSFGANDAMKIRLFEQSDVKNNGDAFIGIGISSNNADSMFMSIEENGGELLVPLMQYAYGASLIPDEDELKQFPVTYGKIADPDGNIIEIQEKAIDSKIMKVMMNVLDLNDAIEFYTDGLGMNLLRKRSDVNSIPKNASLVSYVGFNSEDTGPFIELVYKYAKDKLVVGSEFKGIVLDNCDHSKICSYVESVNEKFSKSKILSKNTDNIKISDLNNYPIQLK